MYYDTHCHPYLAKEKSEEEVLEIFFHEGGKYLNSIACCLESSLACVGTAKRNKGVYASIGIHPTHSLDYIDMLEETIINLEEIYEKNSENIVAIGEAGLDYHWLTSLSERYKIPENEIITLQKDFFKSQIDLAKKLNLPLIIHNREAADDIFEILVETDFKNFVFHCYSEDDLYAEKLLKFAPDCMLGFGGVLTFKNAHKTHKTLSKLPLRNIIIETDSPYLTPTPLRGKQENEPILVKHVLSKVIDLRDESPEEITKQILKNSLNFFGIKNGFIGHNS